MSIPTPIQQLPPRLLTFALTSGLAAVALSAPAAAAGGDLDVSIFSSPRVYQTVQPGTLAYIAGKPAFARAAVIGTGTIPPGTAVDGVMRIFVNGVESADSPVYSDNGPIPVTASASPLNENDSLNFVFVPERSVDVVLTFDINPAGPGQVSEVDFANNVATVGPLDFIDAGNPEVMYIPIDYRPNGQTSPNLPDFDLIKPGVGDNFSQAIFPSSFGEYHRSPVPSKLWTQDVNNPFGGGGGALLASLSADLALTVPQPDFIYGWIPGALPSINGQAIGIPGDAAFGNTEPIRHQRTYSHELGHLYGLSHSSTLAGSIGIDVERHLNVTQGLPLIKLASLNDIMVAGLLTNQAWVAPTTSETFRNHPSFALDTAALADGGHGDSLLIAGLWNHPREEFELIDAFTVTGSRPSVNVPVERADLIVRLYSAGQLLNEAGVVAGSTADCATECKDADKAEDGSADSQNGAIHYGSFVAILPTEQGIDRLTVTDADSGEVVYSLERSSAAPEVAFVSPQSAAVGSTVRLEWAASDADGDELSYAVRYSPDGQRMVSLGTNLRSTVLDVDLSELPALRAGFFEVFASDGLQTTRVRTQVLTPDTSYAGAGGTAPFTFVYTPDSGFSYPFGATVILRSSGWDFDDLGLTGPSIQWTSDLDGPIGSGRVDSVSNLSVGTHVLTVTATDSDGMTSSDSTTITVTARDLPGDDGVDCQANIGFGGPGSSLLEACGGDLSAGTTVDITLTGAVASTTSWLAVSTASNPTPFLGGTVVTVPTTALVSLQTDASGSWTIAGIPGGGGPFSFFIQAAYVDNAQVEGLGFSNAVRLDYQP